jgi:putative redox protein
VSDSPPALALELVWAGEERFRGRSGAVELDIDGNSQAGPSPVQALAFGLAGCMAVDVADILTKGRLPLRALRARLVAQRTPEPPKRLTAVELHFEVKGDMPPDRVERAIALSRERYCSVWHSLSQDIDFRTSFEILA